jgi:hatching enzyme 1
VVAHELGHVIGFFHEQSRSDRDQTIHVNYENIQQGFALQFRKEADRNRGVPYDIRSIMQYPPWVRCFSNFDYRLILGQVFSLFKFNRIHFNSATHHFLLSIIFELV